MTETDWIVKRTDRLWGAIRVVTWLFILAAAALAVAEAYRGVLLAGMDADAYFTDLDPVGGDLELWSTVGAGLAYLVLYIVGAVMVLVWYLRSVRNGHALQLGLTTRPGLVVWWFILPVVSLWKPYEITSQLWRSSRQPGDWKALKDPARLRWWWATVLIGGFLITVADAFSRDATSAGQLTVCSLVLALAHALQAVAGVLFLGIGAPISRLQTALVLRRESPEVGDVSPQTA